MVSESRIFKESRSLVGLGFVDQITLLGIWEPGLPLEEDKFEKVQIKRIKLFTIGQNLKIIRYLSFLEYLIRSFFFSLKFKPEVINCHSLHVLPVGAVAKIFSRKCKLVYDAHELETEVDGSRGIVRHFSKFLEKICFGSVDELIVVSDNIGRWYREHYKIEEVTVIYNVPMRGVIPSDERSGKLRANIGLSKDELLFIYQGQLTRARGVNEILRAFEGSGKRYHIVFMGNGPLMDVLIESSKSYTHIHYHPAVKSEEVLQYTCDADIGIHIITNSCLNHYYCLPNKIFEYLLAGIPFIVSDFPEMAAVANSTKAGWLTQPNAESLMKVIDSIDSEQMLEKRHNACRSRQGYGWEIEEKKYTDLYRRLALRKD